MRHIGPRKSWDDPGWDQADWAQARVVLTDGSAIWLADLPVGPLTGPYTTEAPFSFRYDGQPSSALLKTWELKRSKKQLDKNRIEYTRTDTDPQTGLAVRCVAVAYKDFPIVEWTLYFKNTDAHKTPILENIKALDTRLERNADGEFILHHSRGSAASPTDYEPLSTGLGPKSDVKIAPTGGRPTEQLPAHGMNALHPTASLTLNHRIALMLHLIAPSSWRHRERAITIGSGDKIFASSRIKA
jgi:hypothetical protein